MHCVCVCTCSRTQSCLTLCDSMNCSPPGSSVYGDSSGKNTRVCCHALLHGSSQSREESTHIAGGFFTILATREAPSSPSVLVTGLCPTLCDPMDCSPPGSSVYGDSPGKNTGVGCHAVLQGIFPTQGSNPGFPRYRRILYCYHFFLS